MEKNQIRILKHTLEYQRLQSSTSPLGDGVLRSCGNRPCQGNRAFSFAETLLLISEELIRIEIKLNIPFILSKDSHFYRAHSLSNQNLPLIFLLFELTVQWKRTVPRKMDRTSFYRGIP